MKEINQDEGLHVGQRLVGENMAVEAPIRRRYKLADLMAEMPQGLPLVEGWENMPAVGLEQV